MGHTCQPLISLFQSPPNSPLPLSSTSGAPPRRSSSFAGPAIGAPSASRLAPRPELRRRPPRPAAQASPHWNRPLAVRPCEDPGAAAVAAVREEEERAAVARGRPSFAWGHALLRPPARRLLRRRGPPQPWPCAGRAGAGGGRRQLPLPRPAGTPPALAGAAPALAPPWEGERAPRRERGEVRPTCL